MITLPGYTVTAVIHAGVNTIVYRGLRESDQKPVVIKLLQVEYPTLKDLARLKHEYEILSSLQIPGIVKAYEMVNYNNNLALILEDFEGQSLKSILLNESIATLDFLRIALQITETLGELHSRNIIHKDIKPQNILVNRQTGQVKLIDFSIASLLSRENPRVSSPNLIEGTLAYMSPEQTSRMNRSLDYRTDFYSLGATFYEILTGQLPFTTSDPMELVHCHIAKTPVPPSEIGRWKNGEMGRIPEMLSDIVMKLLAKTAEDRYQSAYGLKVDLRKCLDQLKTTAQILPFPLAQQDKSVQLLIPQKLYGREAEVATLLAAFDRVSLGSTEIVLVKGYSGIGKSFLVHEVHKPIVRHRGYFISGKFDQFKRNIPYSSLIQAFQELIQQLLTESHERIEFWKAKLLKALGTNGRVIIDVIPEVELIIGSQPPVPILGAAEAQNRFNLVFQQFIHVFTSKEHPLAVFLDDLQWADSASLKLIQLLVTEPQSQYLLMIGAYRDNEVPVMHPLLATIEAIQKIGIRVEGITLEPLAFNQVNQLIADSLMLPPQSVESLAEIGLNKTQGNPFFITQLLKSLYDDELLTFNYQEGSWQWDLEKIQEAAITDNVVELMIGTIQKLSKKTQEVLKLAACIGNQFDLNVLSVVNEASRAVTAADLWPALQMGLIVPLSEAYKVPNVLDQFDELVIAYRFLHDRVQQAAYAFIPEEQQKEVHLKVGKLLLKNTQSDELEDHIFEIVNHLNMGAELIRSQQDKYRLSQLNLTAGRKARASSAYEPALRYLTMGIALLGANRWKSQYHLTLALHMEAVEAEYLNTNFERAGNLAEITLQQAKSLLDQVKVYELQSQFYIAQNQMTKAIDIGLKVLDLLNISLSPIPRDENEWVKLPGLAELEKIPVMTEPYKLAALRIIMTVCPAAFITHPPLFQQMLLTLAKLCVEHGHSGLAASVYATYGLLLSGGKGDIDAGYHAGQLSLQLLQQFEAQEFKSKVYVAFYAHIQPWKEHIRESLNPLLEGVQSGLETGDLGYASYCSINYCVYIFLAGIYLESVEKKQLKYVELLLRIKQDFSLYYTKIWRQLGLNLMGRSADKYRLVGESFDEEVMLPYLQETNNQMSLFSIYLAKAILFYLFGEFTQAVDNALLAAEHTFSVMGMATVAVHNFYYSLALLAQCLNIESSEQSQILHQVSVNQGKMQHWAHHAPSNFEHKYQLVEAEKARVLGNPLEAMAYYDQAIVGARKNGYIQEEALAYERAAEFYLSLGREEIAEDYMLKAHYGYVRWGATAKVEDLEARYPQLLVRTAVIETAGVEITGTHTTTSTTGKHSKIFDLTTVIKASQALSSEIVLESLLKKLMKIVIENAGAQKGFFLTKKENKWIIEAEAAVGKDEVTVSSSGLIKTSRNLPFSLIYYVERTKNSLVLDEAYREEIFLTDPYITESQPKSILCLPTIHQGKLTGILYLENNLTIGAFTPAGIEVLKILMTQVSISIENARLYTNLQTYSQELELKNSALQKSLHQLQQTQAQLVQTEKISSLGQLVAGVAHEVNNPVSFISGNLHYASQYTQDLIHHLQLYQDTYPNPTAAILDDAEDIELEYLLEDLPKMLSSMLLGTDRIREIMQSLRNFSRLDSSQKHLANVHEGLESTLLILQHRLKAKSERPAIQLTKEYGELPLVECYAGQLNQVFMNLLGNAIDALDEYSCGHTFAELKEHPNRIRIHTEVNDCNQVVIRIADNGPGMTEEVRSKLFKPFFTTKPVGKGTGLGLSISYQIVVDNHGGQLKCISAPGQGAEFVIILPIKS